MAILKTVSKRSNKKKTRKTTVKKAPSSLSRSAFAGFVLAGVAMGLLLIEPALSFAVTAGGDNFPFKSTGTEETSSDSVPTDGTPYDKTFIVSAYYSPLVGQNKYVTGSYASDIRLNGGGVHGADGSPVYAGMIAAPSVYAFGTKMKIPGIGVVAVHDRGGAIVQAGQKNQPYDRLDVWMGSGDAGLQRALNWGRRTVQVTVYGIDPTLKEAVYLDGYNQAEQYVQAKIQQGKPELFATDLTYGNSSPEVGEMQKSLKTLGYYHGDINNSLDSATQEALVKFQIDAGLVDGSYDFGAGYFGPQTRKALENALDLYQSNLKSHIPQTQLGKDDEGEEVKKLQTALQKLGYDVDVNGVYDNKTIDAIFQFQRANEILSSEADAGAGYFGPKTMQILADKLQQVVDNTQTETIVLENLFTNDLKLGDKNSDVTALQAELRKINLLGVEPNGFYGEVTEHAVFKFQQTQGLVADHQSQGAGVFGPATRARLNALVGQRAHTERLIADKKREELDTIAATTSAKTQKVGKVGKVGKVVALK